MAVLASPAGESASRHPAWRASLRHSVAWHPEWWVYAVAGGAWLVLGWMSRQPTPHAQHVVDQWTPGLWHWPLMVLAMMLPVVAPHVRTVGLRCVWSRRHRSTLAFVLGYVAVWVAVGVGPVVALVLLDVDHHASHLLPVALIAAAAWQVSKPRRRVLRRCSPLRLGAPTGLAADADCARAGSRSALRCVVECGPLMLAMVLGHSLVLMAGLTVVLLTERARGANPQRRAGRPLEAWVLVGFAVVAPGAAFV